MLYRCYMCESDKGNPGRDFEANPAPGKRPVCPNCKLGEDPRDAEHILPLEIIHYDAPIRRNRGQGFASCNPKMKCGKTNAMFTGEAIAVTCSACKQTDVWKVDMRARGMAGMIAPGQFDFPVEIDPTKGTLTKVEETS